MPKDLPEFAVRLPPNSLYLDGEWRAPRSGGTLPVTNPATEELIGRFACADQEDVGDAVDSAARALPPWRALEPSVRASYLRTIAQRLRQDSARLATLEALNQGKVLREADLDVADAAACFDYYAGLADQLSARRRIDIPLPSPDFSTEVRLDAVGVVGQIIPWNFPLLMAAWKVAPALAAGCTTVLKPSELTPLTALALAESAHEVKLPPGVLNVLPGDGRAGAALAEHRRVDKIAFTGSTATGRKIMAAAANRTRPVTLELGGKSPVIVFEDVRIEHVVEWILMGIFFNKGEVCTAASRLLVHERQRDALLAALSSACRRLVVGDPLAPETHMGPLVSAGQRSRVLAYLSQARDAGIHFLCGGGAPPGRDRGFYVEPTIVLDPPVDNPVWTEEIFGPVLAVRSFRTEAEAIDLANGTAYGLAAAVMSGDTERAERVALQIDAGIVWINCSQTLFIEAPFGGVKRSGFGRECGPWGLETYLETKTLTRNLAGQSPGWFPT